DVGPEAPELRVPDVVQHDDHDVRGAGGWAGWLRPVGHGLPVVRRDGPGELVRLHGSPGCLDVCGAVTLRTSTDRLADRRAVRLPRARRRLGARDGTSTPGPGPRCRPRPGTGPTGRSRGRTRSHRSARPRERAAG